MKKSILLIIILALLGCGAPFKYQDIRDHEPTVGQEQKQDPLIESIEYWQKQKCLENCANRELWKKKKCD